MSWMSLWKQKCIIHYISIYSDNLSNNIRNENIDDSKKEILKTIQKYYNNNNNRLNLLLLSKLYKIYNDSKNKLIEIMYIYNIM